MTRSMTGFGRGQVEGKRHRFLVEARSLNHRFLDLNFLLPRAFSWWEPWARSRVAGVVKRGRVDITLEAVRTQPLPRHLQVDTQLAVSYHDLLEELRDRLGLTTSVDINTLALLPDVFNLEDTPDYLEEEEEHLEEALEQALQALVAMREQEGREMARQVTDYLSFLDEQVTVIKERVPEIRESLRVRLAQRIDDLDLGRDDDRIKAEMLYYAERSDVEEELTRLESHLSQMRSALVSDSSVGRKLVFVLQEIVREANTIGSKTSDVEVGGAVVEIKTVSEQLRELVQNLE